MMSSRSRILRVPGESNAQGGFALPLAVAALFIVAAAVSWSVLLALFAFRGGQNTIRLAQALSSAEEGALLQVARVSWAAHTRLPVGGASGFSGVALEHNGSYRGQVSRLSETLFLVAAEGFDPAGRARQRAGVLVRLRPLELAVRAALDTRGGIEIEGRARLSGNDIPPRGWSCPSLRPPVAAARVPARDLPLVSNAGCIDGACIVGSPPILTHEDTDVAAFDVRRIAELEQFATLVLNGGEVYLRPDRTGSECAIGSATNWGDPRATAGACGRHVPFVYSRGDLVIRGGRGQAFLVVEGDLAIHGDTEVFGVILVRGSLVVAGDARIRGAALVANGGGVSTVLTEHAWVGYSSCAVERALGAAGVPTVLDHRAWLRLE